MHCPQSASVCRCLCTDTHTFACACLCTLINSKKPVFVLWEISSRSIKLLAAVLLFSTSSHFQVKSLARLQSWPPWYMTDQSETVHTVLVQFVKNTMLGVMVNTPRLFLSAFITQNSKRSKHLKRNSDLNLMGGHCLLLNFSNYLGVRSV